MKKITLLLVMALSLFAQSAKEHNSKGFAFYKEKNYEAAREEFQKAVEIDPNAPYPLFNKLCTESILYNMGKNCELDIYPDDLNDQLEHILSLKPAWKTKAALDSDLEALRKTIRFHLLTGRDITKDADLVIILEAVEWFGPSPGAYGPMSQVDFSDGYCRFSHLNIDEEIKWEIGDFLPYRVENGIIYITINEKNDKGEYRTIQGKFDGKKLTFEESPSSFTDDSDDCSA